MRIPVASIRALEQNDAAAGLLRAGAALDF
jgi:hypothetical protein